ncbi:hypothetical protein SteCoe_30851 [Stentor coeruleus]|uniref:Uncharacterized protein n=1 Tax=Stentor coeruleus TaxID=5963 RepID=A0A1R2B2P0_9CILI|nr:hypothetical protein SteCoe_30851 [Stentor coeruleus]
MGSCIGKRGSIKRQNFCKTMYLSLPLKSKEPMDTENPYYSDFHIEVQCLSKKTIVPKLLNPRSNPLYALHMAHLKLNTC